MAGYEYSKIALLNESLIKNGINEETRKKIMDSGEFVKKTSSPQRKAEWCCNAMNKMDKLFDENTKIKIREDCACCLGGKREKLCKEVNKKYETTEEKIKAINDTHYVFGNEIKIIGKGKYEVTFHDEKIPEKKCVCLKGNVNKEGSNIKWSKTWCYCCGGHVKHHLETVLGKKVEVKVISSALSSMGKKNCKFELKEI